MNWKYEGLNMRFNPYLANGPLVSEIGLGAWQLGASDAWKSMTENEAIQLVHRSLELGVNFFDTAPNYGLGTSEIRLGKALKSVDREKVVINTKVGHCATGKTDFESGSIRESLEGSLRRLDTDYVDSLILHNPPREYLDGNNTDHYAILEQLVEEGKIKAYGASLDSYDEMKLLMDTTGSKVIEAFFNVLFQDTSRAFETARKNGVGIIVKIPLDSGWLSGKYTAATEFDDIRSRWSETDKKTRAGLVEKVKEIIPDPDRIAQAALSFCSSFDAVSTVIPGNKNIAQLESNIDSTRYRMSPETLVKLRSFYREQVEHLQLPW